MENKFSWTSEYKRAWETEAHANKELGVVDSVEESRDLLLVLRKMVVVVDFSESIEKTDYFSNIRTKIYHSLQKSIESFYTRNPLSTIALLSFAETCLKYAEACKDVSSIFNSVGQGSFCLSNCLATVLSKFKSKSSPTDCLIITASVKTIDQQEYSELIKELKISSIRIHFISISGDVDLYKRISHMTGGIYSIPSSESHFEQILDSFMYPRTLCEGRIFLYRIGFYRCHEEHGLCVCHTKFSNRLAECPSCKALVCRSSKSCPVCKQTLGSLIDVCLAQHYINRPVFNTMESTERCRLCAKNECSYSCSGCSSAVCNNCEAFLHASLGFCIFCNAS
ncbi:transcription initiation factor TFIIH subunit 2 [Enteropsectra breve]|nr:transcription initiation factor TFIIH subunit 2 [Enteropsectra breve]